MSDSLKDRIDLNRVPQHIAVIMDGNGRWAKQKGMPRVFGHRSGVKAVREITEAGGEIGVKYLTLYAFSTENWKRPALEVNALMHLLVSTLNEEIKSLHENNVRIQTIGDLDQLPEKSRKALKEAIDHTNSNTGLTLILALNYSSRWEIVNSTKKIALAVKAGEMDIEDINADSFSSFLATAKIPDPELLIRTSGEKRISNYLLWQLAYTELHFMDLYWPDFKKKHLFESILDFQNRERRFGKTSEQLT